MILFFDTSSLAKRYILESGSEDIDELFLCADEIMVSHITAIEFTSALSRRLRERAIDDKAFSEALTSFNDEYVDYHVVDFSKRIESSALKYVKNHSMKTLDSIQLASAVSSSSDIMVTSDKKLFEIAQIEFKKKSLLIN